MKNKVFGFSFWCWSIFFCFLAIGEGQAKVVEFDLIIGTGEVNFSGRPTRALTINGGIPGPTLTFTEGERARIRVHNTLDTETSIHWHGILLPNREDGVPYLTSPPILPGKTHVFEFPLIQSGTYWYHSHTGLQEQRGIYGSIVIYPREGIPRVQRDYVLVLSDWIDEDPHSVMRMLKRGTGYYSLKKGSVQSLAGAIRAGAVGEVLSQWWDRMPPMDISDVGYDAFLINGKQTAALEAFPGEMVRLRIINASASTYFYLQSAAGPMRLIAADGLDVEPVEISRLLIAVAETYDLLVEMPRQPGAIEIRATAQDGSGKTAVFLGQGTKVHSPDIPKPDLYRMHGSMRHEEHPETGPRHEGPSAPSIDDEKHGHPVLGPKDQGAEKERPNSKETTHLHSAPSHTHHEIKVDPIVRVPFEQRPLSPYPYLRSPKKTTLDPSRPLRKIPLRVTGDMERYVWSFNNRTLKESDSILIRKGENVRIDFVNETMMHHPIHLHGHFFRVLTHQGDYSPLKHTFDLPPMASQSIEFQADEEKDWLLHCHILYHMEAGMHQIVHYEGSIVDPDIAEYRTWKSNHLLHDPWYSWFELSLLSQMSEGRITSANTRNTLGFRWENGWEKGNYDIESTYSRYLNRFWSVFAGGHFTHHESKGIIGFKTLLPLLLEGRAWIDHRGEVLLGLERKIQLTDRLHLTGEVQYESRETWKWSLGARWRLSRWFFLEAKHHSLFGTGIGLSVEY